MANYFLLSPAWQPPAYVTLQPAEPSAEALINLARENQWQLVHNQLKQYSHYQINWDGYGSAPATPSAFKVVDELLKKARNSSWTAPSTATLSPSGAIQIEWWSGSEVLQAEISDINRIDWVRFGPKGAPKHWWEDLTGSARGETWEGTGATQSLGAAAFASQT